MSFHNKPDNHIPELIEALKAHRLPHDTPSQLADSFRNGWMACCRELAQADSVQEDAARWQETLMHVGAASHLGGQHFTLNTLRIRDQMFLLRGSVAQHFTACIDDSRAARKQGEKQ